MPATLSHSVDGESAIDLAGARLGPDGTIAAHLRSLWTFHPTDPVYTEVDKIFQEFGANRAHYFGRTFEGIDIRKIMDQVSCIVHVFAI